MNYLQRNFCLIYENFFTHFSFTLQKQYSFAILSIFKINYLTILMPFCDFIKLMNSLVEQAIIKKKKFRKFLIALLAPL